jgi:hypothetical protein
LSPSQIVPTLADIGSYLVANLVSTVYCEKRMNRTIVGYLNHAKKELNPVNFAPQVLTSVGVGT